MKYLWNLLLANLEGEITLTLSTNQHLSLSSWGTFWLYLIIYHRTSVTVMRSESGHISSLSWMAPLRKNETRNSESYTPFKSKLSIAFRSPSLNFQTVSSGNYSGQTKWKVPCAFGSNVLAFSSSSLLHCSSWGIKIYNHRAKEENLMRNSYASLPTTVISFCLCNCLILHCSLPED